MARWLAEILPGAVGSQHCSDAVVTGSADIAALGKPAGNDGIGQLNSVPSTDII